MNQNQNQIPTQPVLITSADVPRSPGVIGDGELVALDMHNVQSLDGLTEALSPLDRVRSLPSGQVSVKRRTSGKIEDGWSVLELHSSLDGNGGTVVVAKPTPDGRVAIKNVSVEDLLSMQPTPETSSKKSNEEASKLAGELAIIGAATEGISLHLKSPLERAQDAFVASRTSDDRVEGGYGNLFSEKGREADMLIEALNPAERRAFDQWQVDRAARRTPKFGELLAKINKDSGGTYRPDAVQSKAIVESLSQFGIRPESQHDVDTGVETAKRLVAQGGDRRLLDALRFMPDRSFGALITGSKLVQVVLEGAAIEVGARQLSGAEGFDSWMGRGESGTREVHARQILPNGKEKRQSIEQIRDYATRETDIPLLDSFGLSIVLTDKGPVYYSHNAHRAAAAQLRGGALRTKVINLYDVRGNSKKAELVDRATTIVERNSNL